jgi:hypothetical protein
VNLASLPLSWVCNIDQTQIQRERKHSIVNLRRILQPLKAENVLQKIPSLLEAQAVNPLIVVPDETKPQQLVDLEVSIMQARSYRGTSLKH